MSFGTLLAVSSRSQLIFIRYGLVITGCHVSHLCRQPRQECTPSTDGGAGQPPKPPPPPRSTAEGSIPDPDGDTGGFFKWQGWTDRVNADPSFVYKVLVEQVCPHRASEEKQGNKLLHCPLYRRNVLPCLHVCTEMPVVHKNATPDSYAFAVPRSGGSGAGRHVLEAQLGIE